MKVLTFKTVSPLFEMERDGTKPFTTRKVDSGDSRFRDLWEWRFGSDWAVKIVNPATGETFTRKLLGEDYLFDLDDLLVQPEWKILYLGELI